jgi:hypothetical protein
VPVETYEHFASRDVLSAVVLERMLAGVSTRRFVRTQEPVGEQVEGQARSTCWSTSPSVTGQRSSAGYAARGRATTTNRPSENSKRSPQNSNALTQALPHP